MELESVVAILYLESAAIFRGVELSSASTKLHSWWTRWA